MAKAVADGTCEKGIVICTTGIGISISANKIPGIRCALCGDTLSAKMTRLHNDANVLALGAAGISVSMPSTIPRPARRMGTIAIFFPRSSFTFLVRNVISAGWI